MLRRQKNPKKPVRVRVTGKLQVKLEFDKEFQLTRELPYYGFGPFGGFPVRLEADTGEILPPE